MHEDLTSTESEQRQKQQHAQFRDRLRPYLSPLDHIDGYNTLIFVTVDAGSPELVVQLLTDQAYEHVGRVYVYRFEGLWFTITAPYGSCDGSADWLDLGTEGQRNIVERLLALVEPVDKLWKIDVPTDLDLHRHWGGMLDQLLEAQAGSGGLELYKEAQREHRRRDAIAYERSVEASKAAAAQAAQEAAERELERVALIGAERCKYLIEAVEADIAFFEASGGGADPFYNVKLAARTRSLRFVVSEIVRMGLDDDGLIRARVDKVCKF